MQRPFLGFRGSTASVTVLIVSAAPATAKAQLEQVQPQPPDEVMEIATDAPSQPMVNEERWDRDTDRELGRLPRQRDGLRFGGGMAFTREVENGWYGRAEWVLYDQYQQGSGGSFLTLGAEGWRAEEASGGSLPYTISFVLESGWLFVSFGVGFDLFLYDRVYENPGWGLLAPGALASLGLNLDGFRIATEARGKYRWQFRAPDRTQALTGLFFEVPL